MRVVKVKLCFHSGVKPPLLYLILWKSCGVMIGKEFGYPNPYLMK
jgi:hypothetical protein